MIDSISIRPSKDLRTNYAQISALAKENPVAITVNGKEDTVILSHADYINQQKYISELEAKISFFDHLAEGVDDAKLGRVTDINDAFDMLIKEIDNL